MLPRRSRRHTYVSTILTCWVAACKARRRMPTRVCTRSCQSNVYFGYALNRAARVAQAYDVIASLWKMPRWCNLITVTEEYHQLIEIQQQYL
ncbi:hypothetical protein LSAT2_030437 [Lamellibrachia satsuma]|nr:hypothetical protein LSAT2_030437 [Lamellibrachia satsuma]